MLRRAAHPCALTRGRLCAKSEACPPASTGKPSRPNACAPWSRSGSLCTVEAEAILAESDAYTGEPHPRINPHHLSAARKRLVGEGVLLNLEAPTRGGGKIRVLTPTDQHRRSVALAKAAARKRLLAGAVPQLGTRQRYLPARHHRPLW